jgi:hypothetical protein
MAKKLDPDVLTYKGIPLVYDEVMDARIEKAKAINAAEQYVLLRDTDRYPDSDVLRARYPERVVVTGTREQAEFVAELLANYEAGCDGLWYVAGESHA